jgi:hypothetical protein
LISLADIEFQPRCDRIGSVCGLPWGSRGWFAES